jgi:hypothetical protein
LKNELRALVRQVTGFRMKFEQIVALPARLTANLLNNYVDFLGYDALAPEQRPDVAAWRAAPARCFHRARCRVAARN